MRGQLAKLNEAIEVLRQIEFAADTDVEGGGYEPCCPWCEATQREGVHSGSCRLAQVIGAPVSKPPSDPGVRLR